MHTATGAFHASFLAGQRWLIFMPKGAKAAAHLLAGGLPIGAVVMKEKVAQAMAPGDHGSTFAGNPLVAEVMRLQRQRTMVHRARVPSPLGLDRRRGQRATHLIWNESTNPCTGDVCISSRYAVPTHGTDAVVHDTTQPKC